MHLRAGGVSVLLDVRGPGLPSVLHWGADLGTHLPAPAHLAPALPHSGLDVPVPLTLLPSAADGWLGEPALRGSRPGDADQRWAHAFTLHRVEVDGDGGVVIHGRDDVTRLSLTTRLRLEPGGLLRISHAVRNDGTEPYRLDRLAVVLPVPPVATELLDLTGRWCRERHPQRHDVSGQGAWVRAARHGRTGHDATLMLVAGTPGFANRAGEVWGLHLAWSGDHVSAAERTAEERAVLAAAELLGPGEVTLAAGEDYVTPEVFAGWSTEGLDGLADRFHDHVRARAGHVRLPRPVVLNTWEAVYFDHRLERLTELADAAAEIGVERFVLDDGWFLGRRDDHAGLGDWVVDPAVWPGGLAPLIGHVRRLGMDFGLWVEPEMVNVDSELYRAHPDWVLAARGELPPPWRHQQVLDLANPAAHAHLLDRLDALLRDHDIAYLKWDHNRDLVLAGHGGRPAVRAQTLAVYALLDELRRRHPGVEIESCASGGGRADLGILARTDRVWASDTNDALERTTIQRWTQLLLPPELVGSHVGPPTAHTTGRTHDLSFRAAVALFGHVGIEWDVSALSADDRAALAAAVSTYKTHRGLLHTGRVVHADHPDPAALLHGVVARDRREALMAYVAVASSASERPGPARFPGLDPEVSYRVRALDVGGPPRTLQGAAPGWLREGGAVLSGRFLAVAGLPMPVLVPEQALVVHLLAISEGPAPGHG